MNEKSRMLREFSLFLFFVLTIIAGASLGSAYFHVLPVLPVLSNPHGIVSPLAEQNYHPFNNILRFFLFLSAAPMLWWIGRNVIVRSFGATSAYLAPREATGAHAPEPQAKPIWWAAVGIFSVASLAAFTRALLLDSTPIDDFWFFHEGEWLGPAWTWWQTKKIWFGSFFAHGAFYDALAPAFFWHYFDVVSIGASRLGTAFLEHLNYPGKMAFVLVLAYFAFFRQEQSWTKSLFFALSLLTIYELTFPRWQYLERRDFLPLVGYCFLVYALVERRPRILLIPGCLAALTLFYSIDRGAYSLAAAIGIVAAVAVFSREWQSACREIIWILLGFLTGGLLLGLAFGWAEIREGIRTTSYLFAIKDLSDGSIYPNPAFPITNWKFLRMTHTLPLVCLSIQVLAMFIVLERHAWKVPRSGPFLVQLTLLVLSLLYYRSALSRCDELHFRYVSTFPIWGATFVACLAFVSSTLWRRYHWLRYSGLLAVAYLPMQGMWQDLQAIPGRWQKFSLEYQDYLAKADADFLLPWQQNVLAVLQEEFRDEACLYSTVSEPLWIYLLRKPSCGRFHLTWLISDERLQRLAIDELIATNPQKILVHTPRSGDAMDGIAIERRVKLLYGVITERYEPHRNYEGWEIWRRKGNVKEGTL